MSEMMIAGGIIGVIVVIAVLAWWIEVGSVRRHWRQAHEATLRRDFGLCEPIYRVRPASRQKR